MYILSQVGVCKLGEWHVSYPIIHPHHHHPTHISWWQALHPVCVHALFLALFEGGSIISVVSIFWYGCGPLSTGRGGKFSLGLVTTSYLCVCVCV